MVNKVYNRNVYFFLKSSVGISWGMCVFILLVIFKWYNMFKLVVKEK